MAKRNGDKTEPSRTPKFITIPMTNKHIPFDTRVTIRKFFYQCVRRRWYNENCLTCNKYDPKYVFNIVIEINDFLIISFEKLTNDDSVVFN